MENKTILEKIKSSETAQRVIASIVMLLLTIVSLIISYNFLRDRPKDQKVNITPNVDVATISKGVDHRATELEKLKNMQALSIYPDGLVTPQSLIDACKQDSLNQKVCNNEITNITKRINSDGQIKSAKLYIKAGVSRNGLPLGALTKHDSIWIFLDEPNFSGHLLRSKAVFNGLSNDGLTELIYDLSDLPLTTELPYSEDNKARSADFLKQINSINQHFISSFVSTLGYGKIEDFKIYYEEGNLSTSD